jgi:imidazolonepropionase-like amidohydrolase/poly(3-hydroxybutyrate) depolymerase
MKLHSLVIAASAIVSSSAAAAQLLYSGAGDQAVAISNVRIFDGARVLQQGTVVFMHGTISAVGSKVTVPAGAQIIDGSGKTLLPGLIDAHVHMADSYRTAGGLPLEQAAVYGITTVMDLASSNPGDYQEFKQKVRAGAYPQGADIYTAGVGATAPGGHGSRGQVPTLTSVAQVPAWVNERAATGSDYIKVVSETFAEHFRDVPTISDEIFAAVVSEAHRHGLLAVSHTLQQFRARRAVEAGIDGLVHISPYDVPDPDFGQLMAKHKVFQSTNLISYAPVSTKINLAKDPDLAPFMPKFMIDGLLDARPFADAVHQYSMAAFRLLHLAGVKILAGTDIGYPYAPLLHAELELMVRDGGLTPVEALMTATSNTTGAYRLKDRGWIKPGMRADLLLVTGDPTTRLKDLRNISAVWARGVAIDRAAYQAKLPDMKAPTGGFGGPPPAAAAPVVAPPPAAAPKPVTVTFQGKGDQRRSYQFAEAGESMPYRLYVPFSWTPAKKVPLVLMLHGGGLDENAAFDREPMDLKGQLFALSEKYGYILVAPLGYRPTGGYGNIMSFPPGAPPPAAVTSQSPEQLVRTAELSEKDTLNVLELVAQEYKVDRSRIFLMGNSMGSGGAMHLASKYPERWLAIAPSEGAMDASRFGDKLGKLRAAGVMIVKKDDTEALRTSATELVRQIGQAGGKSGINAQLVVVPDSKHESAWYLALPQIFAFFDKFAKQ